MVYLIVQYLQLFMAFLVYVGSNDHGQIIYSDFDEPSCLSIGFKNDVVAIGISNDIVIINLKVN